MDPVYRYSLCRFCLCNSDNLLDLFGESCQHGFIIEEAIEDLLRVKVTKTDGYPPFICLVCFGKLNTFRLFKCQCNDSRIEYANRFFGKGNNYAANDIHSLPAEYLCFKQEAESQDGYVPCEVSIKTEQEDADLSTGALVFSDVREMSDDNYSEGEDGKDEGDMIQMEADVPTERSYYSKQNSNERIKAQSEMPQKRKSWDKVSMIRAVDAVINKEMSLLKASKTFNVPRSTIKDYVKKNGRNSVDASIGRKPVLPSDVEEELVRYCQELERAYFGLTPRDVERMAYHLANRNDLKHPFSDEKQAAGRKWVKQFFRRHPNLVYRKPQTLTAARIAGFKRPNVEKFFSLLEPELARVNFSPERIFSVDEMGLALTLDRSVKVLFVKGRGQIESLSQAERGNLVTIIACMSASGVFVPPVMVLPRSEATEMGSAVEGFPSGTLLCRDPCGWVQPETFLKWLRHFVEYVKPSRYVPVVLVMDAHYAHNRSIEVMEFARSNGVLLVSLPPHSTHKMHPVEVSFVPRLRACYVLEVERWRAANGGVAMVTSREVPGLLGKAYREAATVEVAANGYWKTGISPFQRNAFGDHDFASNSRGLEAGLEVVEQGQLNHGMVGDAPNTQQPGTSGKKHSALLSATSPYA